MDKLLQEDGSYVLQEDNTSKILLEQQSASGTGGGRLSLLGVG